MNYSYWLSASEQDTNDNAQLSYQHASTCSNIFRHAPTCSDILCHTHQRILDKEMMNQNSIDPKYATCFRTSTLKCNLNIQFSLNKSISHHPSIFNDLSVTVLYSMPIKAMSLRSKSFPKNYQSTILLMTITTAATVCIIVWKNKCCHSSIRTASNICHNFSVQA